MKRKGWFFSVVLPLIAASNIAAAALMTGCSTNRGYYDSNLFRKFDSDKDDQINDKIYTDLPTVNYSFNNLFSGTRNYNSGNYMLIIGSISDLNNNYLISNRSTEAISNCQQKVIDHWKGTLDIFGKLADVRDKDGNKVKIDLLIYQTLVITSQSQNFPGLIDQNDRDPKYFQAPADATDKFETYADSPFLRYSNNEANVKKQWRNKYVRDDAGAKIYRNLFEHIGKLQISSLSSISEVSPIIVLAKWDAKTSRVDTQVKQCRSSTDADNLDNEIKTFYQFG